MFKYSFIAVIVSIVLLSACADSHQKSAEKTCNKVKLPILRHQHRLAGNRLMLPHLNRRFQKQSRTPAQFPCLCRCF